MMDEDEERVTPERTSAQHETLRLFVARPMAEAQMLAERQMAMANLQRALLDHTGDTRDQVVDLDVQLKLLALDQILRRHREHREQREAWGQILSEWRQTFRKYNSVSTAEIRESIEALGFVQSALKRLSAGQARTLSPGPMTIPEAQLAALLREYAYLDAWGWIVAPIPVDGGTRWRFCRMGEQALDTPKSRFQKALKDKIATVEVAHQKGLLGEWGDMFERLLPRVTDPIEKDRLATAILGHIRLAVTHSEPAED